MSLDILKNGDRTVVGVKQTLKAIELGGVKQVLIAADADSHVVEALKDICVSKQIPCEKKYSMQEIGKACGIHVGAAAAAILNF